MSLSVFNPSLCCLSPFHLFLCHSFKAIFSLTRPHYYIILELCNPEFSELFFNLLVGTQEKLMGRGVQLRPSQSDPA